MKELVSNYLHQIKRDYEESRYLISLVSESATEEIEDLYIWSTISMCIKYEAFTADAYAILFPDKRITFNHPWRYTREIAKCLSVNISREYKRAHDSWYIYNTMKHINDKTKEDARIVRKKYKLKTNRDVQNFIFDSLTNLLNKFI